MPPERERLAWFPFTPKDWLDYRVLRMSLAAQGAYMRLLCHMWIDSEDQCSLPLDEISLSRLLSTTPKKTKQILSEMFSDADPIFFVRDGRFFSKRLSVEKAKGDKLRNDRRKAGKKGADTRYSPDSDAIAPPSQSYSAADSLPLAKPSDVQVHQQYKNKEEEEMNTSDESSPSSSFLDYLFLLSKKAGVPNKPERVRAFLGAWVHRFGADNVERVMLSPASRGLDLIALSKVLESKFGDQETARGLVASALDTGGNG